MLKSGLFWRTFIGALIVGLGSVLTVGLVTRAVFTQALGAYVRTLPGQHGMGGPMSGGRTAVIGVAEQAFVASVDRGVLLGGLVAAVVAAIAAFLLARAVSSPLRRLEEGAALIASGDLGHRVEVGGPGEVATLGESFNTMADSLQEAEDLRRRMVADVAHEIRNPVAAARAQAEAMAEGIIAAETDRLHSLVDDLGHLSRIIDDLQELAHAEAGHLTYEMDPLDISGLVAGEARRAAGQAAPGVKVRAPSADPSVIVMGDEGRLLQVMRNLLHNAVRHTTAGHIEVVLATSGDTVEVRVTDTGEGIDPDDLPHVFERFYRTDSARSSEGGGAGLGLSISRRIVEDHGGHVFAHSERGHGTTIGFRLPLAP